MLRPHQIYGMENDMEIDSRQQVALDDSFEQLVVMEIASESYGVDIGAVNTIIRMQEVTAIPRTPDFVEGVINLRGSIIPVIDLRKRFGLKVGETTKASRIVVVEAAGQVIGMIVDAVGETLRLAQSRCLANISWRMITLQAEVLYVRSHDQ